MPPRLHLFTALRYQARDKVSYRSFHASPLAHESIAEQKRRAKDPYLIAQAQARRAANLSRQEILKAERSRALGDPIRGIETPFVKTLDPKYRDESPEAGRSDDLNKFVTKEELQTSLANSERLSEPVPAPEHVRDPQIEHQRRGVHQQQDKNAQEALQKILSLEKGSSQDWMRANIQRCIERFGRHNTDKTLKSRFTGGLRAGPAGRAVTAEELNADQQSLGEQRAGPDTGSPEVQVAILTSRIRTLSYQLDNFGRHDKMNKKNLRLLVHRRQKLLKYLRKRERGSERWSNLTSMLGLTEGTWKGEISL